MKKKAAREGGLSSLGYPLVRSVMAAACPAGAHPAARARAEPRGQPRQARASQAREAAILVENEEMAFVSSLLSLLESLPAGAARALILVYRVTFSAFAGRSCRYAPTCSEYAEEAIAKHGLWAGGWMGFARICRCRPGGGEGFDPVPERLPAGASAFTPWRYARWRGPFRCEEVDE